MAYMCNTSNIKEMEIGRPQTVMFEKQDPAQPTKTFPNGTIVELGDTLQGKNIPVVNTPYGRDYDHVHKVEPFQGSNPLVGVDTAAGKWIVVAPEINIEEYRLIDGQISKFSLEENVTYTAYQLQKYDRIEYTYSTERFEANIGTFAVGNLVKINAAGKFEQNVDGAFRVVSVVDTHLPFTLAVNGQPNQGAALLPTVGKKIKLEVVK